MNRAPLPYGVAFFADDVRNEVGNKQSLMGIYGGTLLLAPGTVFPAALAKIGVMVVWKEPTEGHAKSLTFKASISPLEAASENTEEETTLIEFGFDMAEVKKNMPIEQGANLNLQITPTFVLSPVVIAAPSKIRITVLRDGERWAIGRLNIPVAPAAEEVVQTPSKTEPT